MSRMTARIAMLLAVTDVICLAPAYGYEPSRKEMELTVARKTEIYLREKKAERRANLAKWRRVASAPAAIPDQDRWVQRAI